MEWGVRIPLFGKIGNLLNFLLYTAKIVFFGHTVSVLIFKFVSSEGRFMQRLTIASATRLGDFFPI
jgi:hypothetical protein